MPERVRGILWYAAAVIAAIVAGALAWKRTKIRPALIAFAALLFISGGFA